MFACVMFSLHLLPVPWSTALKKAKGHLKLPREGQKEAKDGLMDTQSENSWNFSIKLSVIDN